MDTEFEKKDELYALALTLVGVVKKIFRERTELQFSKPPYMRRKRIIEFARMMRVYGTEMFQGSTFISTVNYYLNEKDVDKHNAVGALVVYVEQFSAPDLLRILKYPVAKEKDDEAIKDCVGTLCNIIAGQFKTAIIEMGYMELQMSHFSNYRNRAMEGVEFCPKQPDKYEISFDIGGEKMMVIEMTMGHIPPDPSKFSANIASSDRQRPQEGQSLKVDIVQKSRELQIPPSVYEKILKGSFGEMVEALKDLGEAISADDFTAIEKGSHCLQGVSGNLRINEMYLVAGEMNKLAKAGKDKDKIIEHLETFKKYLIQLRESFKA